MLDERPNVTESHMTVKHLFLQTFYMYHCYCVGGERMTKSEKMELIYYICFGKLSYTQYITYADKLMNVTELNYQKARDIASSTMCNNSDPKIYLPH